MPLYAQQNNQQMLLQSFFLGSQWFFKPFLKVLCVIFASSFRAVFGVVTSLVFCRFSCAFFF